MLAFERIGSGPPLVLLHGVGHRRQMFELVSDHFCDSYPDYPCQMSGDRATWECGADAMDYLRIESRDDDLLPNWSDWEVRESVNA